MSGSQNLGTADGLGTIGAAGAGTAAGGAASAGGDSPGLESAAAYLKNNPRAYSLHPLYFRRELFKSTADCLTSAYAQRLPLEVCR